MTSQYDRLVAVFCDACGKFIADVDPCSDILYGMHLCNSCWEEEFGGPVEHLSSDNAAEDQGIEI